MRRFLCTGRRLCDCLVDLFILSLGNVRYGFTFLGTPASATRTTATTTALVLLRIRIGFGDRFCLIVVLEFSRTQGGQDRGQRIILRLAAVVGRLLREALDFLEFQVAQRQQTVEIDQPALAIAHQFHSRLAGAVGRLTPLAPPAVVTLIRLFNIGRFQRGDLNRRIALVEQIDLDAIGCKGVIRPDFDALVVFSLQVRQRLPLGVEHAQRHRRI